MRDDGAQLWLQDTMNQLAVKQAAEAIGRTGMALPCQVTAVRGSIVTVAFQVTSPWALPQITIPKAESAWIRSPTQVGDFGLTVPADVYLGGISGLGGGTPNDARPGALSVLVWVPVAATSFGAVNTNAAYVSGPQGAVIQDTAGNCVAMISSDGTITLSAKTAIVLTAPTIELNGNVSQTAGGGTGTVSLVGPVNVANDVKAGAISLETHMHSGVQSGGSDTGEPVA